MKILHYFMAPAAAVLLLAACNKDRSTDLPYQYQSDVLRLPAERHNYAAPTLPTHMANTKAKISQKVTDAGATLGRVLFYDKKLSLTNNTACASCHFQDKAFADPVAFSRGFDGGLTTRNASSIVNPVERTSFFWDARESSVKSMVLKPIENHIEMGMDNFEALTKKLANLEYYQPLFKDAFGTEQVTEERIADALSQFLNSIVSGNSKFDESSPNGWGVDVPLTFTPEEKAGMEVFFNKASCGNCHNPSASSFQAADMFATIGLDANPTDLGLGANQPGMEGMFKVPALRNVAFTAPYMHDGRFATLEEVVEHYNSGINFSENLDWSLRDVDGNGTPIARKMNLTQKDKSDLVAFLHTLTDKSFLTDDKYSNPFKQ